MHGGGFSEVLWGRKRWFLAPVGVTPRFDPNRTTLYWFHNDYRETVPANMSFLGGLYDCVIGPGEILWFPANWYHATVRRGMCTGDIHVHTWERGVEREGVREGGERGKEGREEGEEGGERGERGG